MWRKLVIVVALVGSAAHADSDWVYIGNDSDNNRMSIDGTSFTFETPTIVSYWEKGENRRTGHIRLTHERIDCKQNVWTMLSTQERDAKGRVVNHYDNAIGPRAIPPDSVMSGFRAVACGEKNLHDLPPNWSKPSE